MSRLSVDHDSHTLIEHSLEVLKELARSNFHTWAIRQQLIEKKQSIGETIQFLEELEATEKVRLWISLLEQLRETEATSVVVSLAMVYARQMKE